jgi:biopolymer transport protein ExbD
MKLASQLPSQSPWLLITPLLNAILLLLVYFLFSSGFVIQSGITVERPRSTSRLSGFDRAHLITLQAGEQGAVFLDGNLTPYAQLRQSLLHWRQGERKVLIHADRLASTGRLTEVSNLAMELGFEVALATEPALAPSGP